MSYGYVYCMSNSAMPGLLKIGYTERTISERLEEANGSTWVPQPFSVDMAKFVKEPNTKEQILHRFLAGVRVNPKREFFQTTVDYVRPLFELMDGPWWDSDEKVDVDNRLVGNDVISQFLNTTIYPNDDETKSVTQQAVMAAFQTWKKEQGYTNGNIQKLRDKLIECYGKPERGEGWVQFRLKTDS